MKRKGLIIIIDGLGDRPCRAMDNLTPLQAATTPQLDHIAGEGQCGLMDLLMPGIPVETHTGVGILLGMPPHEAIHLSRGPVEAAGIGLDLQYGDILLRANLATIETADRGFRIIDRRAGRITEGTHQLCRVCQNIELDYNISASLYPATHHRAVLRLRGKGLSELISDTDPGGSNMERGVLLSQPLNLSDPASELTAKALNQFTSVAFQKMNPHPLNHLRIAAGQMPATGIICRGAGVYKPVTNLLSSLGLSVSIIAGEKTIIGLSRLFDFHSISASTFTSMPNTDVDGKFAQALEQLQQHDLVYVHFKGTDTASHDRDPQLKKTFIERIDRALAKLELKELVVGICADHSTDSIRGEHNGDPVPVILRDPTGRRDRVNRFNEIDCINGLLGRISGQAWLSCFLDAMGVLKNYKPAYSEMYFKAWH